MQSGLAMIRSGSQTAMPIRTVPKSIPASRPCAGIGPDSLMIGWARNCVAFGLGDEVSVLKKTQSAFLHLVVVHNQAMNDRADEKIRCSWQTSFLDGDHKVVVTGQQRTA